VDLYISMSFSLLAASAHAVLSQGFDWILDGEKMNNVSENSSW